MTTIEQLTREFLEANRELIKNRDIKSLINLVPHIMAFVEALKEKKTGEEKKQLVIDIINKLFDETTIGGPIDPIIDAVAKVVVPEIIEVCILISKGVFNIQMSEEEKAEADRCKSCFSWLLCCRGGGSPTPPASDG